MSDAFTVPEAIEPLVGWRYWRLDDDGLLASLGDIGFSWTPHAPFRAGCTSGQRDPADIRFRYVSGLVTDHHDSPEERCRCGIYAARSLQDLRGQMLSGLSLDVVGEVYVWGKVIPGVLGYRAQWAYPKHLYVLGQSFEDDKGPECDGLAAYGVPVEVMPYRDAAFDPRLAFAGVWKRIAAVLGASSR